MKEYKITEEQIKDLHSLGFTTVCQNIESWFPECFKKEPELNKWYKHSWKGFFFFTHKNKGHGLDANGNWHLIPSSDVDSGQWDLATESEVFEMLKIEAEKRGFADKNGVNFIGVEKNCYGTINHTLKTEILFDSDKNGGLYASKGWIFKNGKWATIVETPKEISIAEAKEIVEKQLGHKVKIVS